MSAGVTVPLAYRVVSVVPELTDTVSLTLDPVTAAIATPVPGQFTMLSTFAVGEVPISVSTIPSDDGRGLGQTIRVAGAATAALAGSGIGATIGVRGPFGSVWPIPDGDVVVAAGGIGLAPLLPAVRALAARRTGSLCLLVGARRPPDILARAELDSLRERCDVHLIVDAADRRWHGEVGVVTELVRRVPFPLSTATGLVCGPEIMMRFVARELVGRGMGAANVHVSLERNMQCGHGVCGHCQLGPLLLCTDGPVVTWDAVEPILAVRSR